MRIAWATDVHLDHASEAATAHFVRSLVDANPDLVALTGDIAEAESIGAHLDALTAWMGRPILFVLGNHDYYGGSFETVDERVGASVDGSPLLHWMDDGDALLLEGGVSVVGVGGWGDARHGDFLATPVRLNDHILIEDLANLPRPVLQQRLQARGDEAGACLAAQLEVALAESHRIVVLTHVPPFVQSCWYDGEISTDDWLADFTCKATGDVLRATADDHPHAEFLVLCGHTHSPGVAKIAENLTVVTAGARYGRPAIAHVLDLDESRARVPFWCLEQG